MSSIQEALRRAQKEGESKSRDLDFLLRKWSARPFLEKGRFQRVWPGVILILTLVLGSIFLHNLAGREKTGTELVSQPFPQGQAKATASAGKRPSSLSSTHKTPRREANRIPPAPVAAQDSPPVSTSPEKPGVVMNQRPSERTNGEKEAKRPRPVDDYEEVVAVLSDLISKDPNRVDAIINLANIYLRDLGEPAKAISLYQQALDLEPERATVHVNLGVYYLLEGEFHKARGHLQRALNLDPGMAEAHYNLACLYAREGERARAEQALDRAVEIDSRCARWAEEDADLHILGRSVRGKYGETP